MRILVLGAGSLGSVAGGLLAGAGHEVTLVGREGHMRAISERGLRIQGIWGTHHIDSLVTKCDTAGLARGQFDLILIAVKSYDTPAAVESIAPLADANTLVCSYQNGLGNAECIAQAVGWERSVGARVIFGAWLPEDGCAEVTVIAEPTALGTYSEACPSDRVAHIAAAMDAAGLPTVYTDQIETLLWAKVAYNCALNPMSALLDTPYGALKDREHTRAIMRDAVHELYAVGSAMGVELEPATAGAYIERLYEVLIPPTATHYASMREDFRRHRRTEIEALNGAIVRYGAERGILCPVNATLTRLVHAREEGYGIKV